MHDRRSRVEPLAVGVGVEECNILVWQADTEFHTTMLPQVLLYSYPNGFSTQSIHLPPRFWRDTPNNVGNWCHGGRHQPQRPGGDRHRRIVWYG